MLGFAMRAGKLIIGTENVTVALSKRKKPYLVVIASDVSEATRKKLFSKCEFYTTKAVQIDMRTETLGALLGKTYTPACVGVTDEGFAREIEKAASAD